MLTAGTKKRSSPESIVEKLPGSFVKAAALLTDGKDITEVVRHPQPPRAPGAAGGPGA